MAQRKANSAIDSGWPHQVVLPADQCSGGHYVTKHEFCRGLSLCPRGHFDRRDDRDYVVFCFADAAHAALFRERFGSEPVDAKARTRR
ncbi:MAG: hypothetical protein ACKVP3_24190 [Hyphomicrobiaceae bacterium]